MTARNVAQAIANEVFTNGAGEKAQRLVLELEDESDGGGLCRAAFVDRVEKILVRLKEFTR